MAANVEATGSWLATAMEAGWGIAEGLLDFPEVADLLGERHAIITNDWQNAFVLGLISRQLRRSSIDAISPSRGCVRTSPASADHRRIGPGEADRGQPVECDGSLKLEYVGLTNAGIELSVSVRGRGRVHTARTLVTLLRRVSVAGTVEYRVVAGVRRDESIAGPASGGPPGPPAAADAWRRLGARS